MRWISALVGEAWREGLKAAAWYLVVAVAWVTLSDELLLAAYTASSAQELTRYQTAKGLAFVAASAFLLCLLVVRSAKRLESTLRLVDETETTYLQGLERAEVAIFIQRGERLLSANDNAARLLGVASSAQLIGHNALDFLEPANREEITRLVNDYVAAGKESPLVEHKLVRLDGTVLNAKIAVARVRFRGRVAIQMLVHDVTALRAEEQRAADLLNHDPLTRLPNVALLRDRLELALIHAARSGRCVAVGMLNIDRFQRIVDKVGYLSADEVLQAFAARLSAAVRQGDTVARIGGDEFAFALTDVADRADVGTVVAKLVAELGAPFAHGGQEIALPLTGGVSIYPDDGGRVDELMANANAALYRARESARGSIEYYQEKVGRQMRERANIARALPEAIRRNEFLLYYQPQVRASSNAIVACEALIRWNSPELGFVAPGDFIPVAEDIGLIDQIGDWVLREACAQIGRWRETGLGNIVVSVNLSARQLRQGGLAQSIARVLEEHRVDPRLIEIELTESALLSDIEQMIAAVRRLKAIGVSLAIDDFGTGYSSLAHLRRFQADCLKIDQSFVSGIPEDREAALIVKSMISLGEALGMNTVAEGVESEQQAQALTQWGCLQLQGYYFARPAPASVFEASLRASRPGA